MENNLSAKEYITNKYQNYIDYVESLISKVGTDEIIFQGEGNYIVRGDNQNEYYYMFTLNNITYASVLIEKDKVKKFLGVIEYAENFLKTPYFKSISTINNKKYREFAASVKVDVKPYDYNVEHKLLFSKQGKVDLFFSHHIKFKASDEFECKQYPSLKTAIDFQKKADELNERMNSMKK